jgi:choline dehydrogenase-like flavoprotein
VFVDSSRADCSGVIECETCVIGAGPAGIVTALELEARGREVVLLESGGINTAARVQELATAEIADPARHAPLSMAVQRRLGGTSGIWGGRCVPFDPVDFAHRPYVAGPGWPITHEEMARWYPQACEYLVAGAAQFALPAGLRRDAEPIVPGFRDGDVLATTLERWCLPTDLGREYRERLRGSTRIRVHLGATCTGLVPTARTDSIVHALARNVNGGKLAVRARHFVVATGGVETVRLLLNSGPASLGGLGNSSGLLGAGYMGHISGKIADIQFHTPAAGTISGFERDRDGVYCRRRFTVSAALQLREELLNCAFWLDNPAPADASHRNGILSAAYLALSTPAVAAALAPAAIRDSVIGHPAPSSRVRHLANVLTDLPATARFMPGFLLRRYTGRRRLPGFFLHSKANRYSLHYHGEQVASPASRITLSQQRDALGMRRARVDLRFCSQDYRSVRRSHEILDGYLRGLGIGALHYRVADALQAVAAQARDGLHQLGGTRMAARAEHGVVDAHCRVHALANLYLAGSSVFATSGQANPTLSIVALAVRLAERMDQQLRAPAVRLS